MTNISLTDLIEYISKSGTHKFSVVKKIKRREEYKPSNDYWRKLRSEIIDFHIENKPKEDLSLFLKHITDLKKQKSYPPLVKQYQSFLGRKKIEWFDIEKRVWIHNNLKVRINPELGLKINGKKYLIKLYFKADKLP